MISVCMATYNGSKYIKEQIDSILSQLSLEDELIISDDHSTDNTVEIIKSLNDPRIKIFMNELEKGYTRNFENAINKSSGEIIFLADQDDVWCENKVELMLKALSNVTLVISDARVVDGELKTLKNSHFAEYGVKTGFLHNFLKTRYIGACMAFKRELLEKAMPFPKNQKLCAHDYWIALVGEAYYKVALINEPLMLYRRHGNNALTGGDGSTRSLSMKLKVRSYCALQLMTRLK